MEQTLPSKRDTQSLALTEKVVDLAKVLVHYNQLTAFPYSDLQISEWAKSINELMPNITPDTLKTIINRMKMGIYEYDSRIGIQNIFSGAREYIRDEISTLQSSISDIKRKMFIHYNETVTDEERKFVDETELKIKKLHENLFKISPKNKMVH